MEDEELIDKEIVGPPTPQAPDLVQLDDSYMKMQQRHQHEINSINSQRAARLSDLSDAEVYRQLYEQSQLDVSRGKYEGIDQGVLRPESAPFYNKDFNQTYSPPRSEQDQRYNSSVEMLGGTPTGGSPFLKAAQIMGQSAVGAPKSSSSQYDGKRVQPKEVYNYLKKDKGLSEYKARGILANISAESGFFPGAKEMVKDKNGVEQPRGIGLFQHTYSTRKEAFKKAVPDWETNWKGQIDFALQEQEAKKFLDKKFNSAAEATEYFTRKFENPADVDNQVAKRVKLLEDKSLNFQGNPETVAEWEELEEGIDQRVEGHPGDLFGGQYGSAPNSHFGAHRNRSGSSGIHQGHDTATPIGTDLPAPTDGVLSPEGLGGADLPQGHSIRFYGADGHGHKFMHMKDALDINALAKKLDRPLNPDGTLNIKRGDIIGQTGASGLPTRKGQANYGAHLHHEVLKLKPGKSHDLTGPGIGRGYQENYNKIDPLLFYRINAMGKSNLISTIKDSVAPDFDISPRSYKSEAKKPSADLIKFLEDLKAKNQQVRNYKGSD